MAYCLLLNQKGKVEADAFIVRVSGTELWLVSYRSPGSVLRERLEAYVIADDVVIEDRTGDFELLTLVGEAARGWLEQNRVMLPESGGWSAVDGGGFLFRGRRGPDESWEWLALRGTLPVAPLPVLSAEDLERCRIEAGIPAIPGDLGSSDLPNEGGLEEVAISYTKGCYLGQEVMARLKAMGKVRRRLLRVRGPAGPIPALPTDLYQGDKRVGELRSQVSDSSGGVIGLAMLSLLALDPGAALSLSPGIPGAFKVVDLP